MIFVAARRLLASVRNRIMRVEHLSDSEIAGFLDRDLSADEFSSVEGHLESCAACRAATVEVSRLAGAYNSDNAAPPVPGKSSRWTRRVPAVVGLMAAASVAIVLMGRVGGPTKPDSVRSATTLAADARPILHVIGPPEIVPTGDSSIAFVWRSGEANLYRFSILDDTGNPVVERELPDTALVLPRATLVPGRLYFWRVDAVADGIAATSGARKLELAR